LPTNVIRCLPSTSSQLRAGEANSCCAPDPSRLEAEAEAINWWHARRCLESPIISFMRPCRGSAFGYAAAQKHFSWSSLQDTSGCLRSEAFAWGTRMMKFLSLGFVLAAAMLGSGCISLSSTRTAPPPPPAPSPVVQRTVYPDGTYVDQTVQPVPR
jgi:hypothetical protein